MSHTLQLPRPLAIIAGVRTPFAKAFTALADRSAVQLGITAALAAMHRAGVEPSQIDETIIGNVSCPADAANISRVVALGAGIPHDRPAFTVNRNCASGMESLISAWQAVASGQSKRVLAGGTESMSQVPLLWDPAMQNWLMRFSHASKLRKLSLLAELRPKMLTPIVGLQLGLTDPTCGLNMGETAEVLAEEFDISRDAQDRFALESHQKATAAWQRCFLGGEVTPLRATETSAAVDKDVGPRANQSLEALAKLKPLFAKENGTVTAGNSCPITDGAAMMVVMDAEQASASGMHPLGYLRAASVVGCDPRRMGLGPVFAISHLLADTGKSLADFELFEINEAFAVQVLACVNALDSSDFAQKHLGRLKAVGSVDPMRLNVNGGAIALGHPVGTTGTRLVLTLLRALKEKKMRRGIASLCVGGGQGVAMWLETELEES